MVQHHDCAMSQRKVLNLFSLFHFLKVEIQNPVGFIEEKVPSRLPFCKEVKTDRRVHVAPRFVCASREVTAIQLLVPTRDLNDYVSAVASSE